jgi:hypothetical protein
MASMLRIIFLRSLDCYFFDWNGAVVVWYESTFTADTTPYGENIVTPSNPTRIEPIG